jgi:DNA-binding NarL/FixJ family response regulator
MSQVEQHMPRVSADNAASARLPEESAAIIPSTVSSRRDSSRKTTIAIIDEFPLRRTSTLNLLRVHIGKSARSFGGAAELLTKVPTNADAPCCIIMCVGGNSVTEAPLPEQLQRLARALASTPVIVLSDREESEEVVAAFRQGARGYIPTSLQPGIVIEAIKMVLAGGAYLPADALVRSRRRIQLQPETERQPCPEQIAPEQIAPEQIAVKQIALALAMEDSTVKVHVRHIMRKLGVSNRTEAALSARRLGIPATLDDALASIVPGPVSLQLQSARPD